MKKLEIRGLSLKTAKADSILMTVVPHNLFINQLLSIKCRQEKLDLVLLKDTFVYLLSKPSFDFNPNQNENHD